MTVLYKLETFEGPLDLLLHLVDKAEIDIYDIPVSEITDQYMAYVHAMQQMELDVASEFLVMAATLLSMKSRMLLPKPPAGEPAGEEHDPTADPRAELVQKLVEYRKFKAAADYLRGREAERSFIFAREPADLTPYMADAPTNPVRGLGVADLALAFLKVLRRAASRDRVEKIRREELSVRHRIAEIVRLLWAKGGKVLFSSMIGGGASRGEIVVTVLALLELMKIKRVICYQHRPFDDIVIRIREEGEAFGLPADQIGD